MKPEIAVIMAAGKGTRFGSLTAEMPKGFIPFKGKPMVIRSVEALIDAGIKEIIIGTGYHREHYERLAELFPEVKTVFSPRFADTNSMETLYRCREAIAGRPFLLLESDIVYDISALKTLIDDPHPDIMLITPVTKFQDQYYVEADSSGNLAGCSTDKSEVSPSGELVGIHKISPGFYKAMTDSYFQTMDEEPKLGYEFQILRTAKSYCPMHVLNMPRLQWYEIDDTSDLAYAEKNIALT